MEYCVDPDQQPLGEDLQVFRRDVFKCRHDMARVYNIFMSMVG